jgi:hypothetical protein
MPTSSTYPNGVNDFCVTEPQNIFWYVGGNFYPDIVDVGEGAWTISQSYGTSCTAPLMATKPGQTTIYFVLGLIDPYGKWYIPEDVNSNPLPGYIVKVTVTVHAQTSPPTPPPAGVSQLVVTITSPYETASSPAHTPTSNPIVVLQGTVSGGTPPYTATWTALSYGHSYTISTFSSSGIHPIGLPFPDDRWDLSSNGCYLVAYSAGVMAITLTVTDSNGQTVTVPPPPSPPSPLPAANINCPPPIQTISPFPGTALVSLLTVLFTITAERKIILENKPWPRMLRTANSQRGRRYPAPTLSIG